MTYEFTLTATLPASPDAVYEAWMSSAGHTAMIGIDSNVSDQVGAAYDAGGGYIWGTNVALERGRRIVQTWRTHDFLDEDVDSQIEVLLEPAAGGTLLTLLHTNVPSHDRGYEDGGWEQNYFEPMREYFSKRD